MNVYLENCESYDQARIDEALDRWRPLFAAGISPGDRVVLKPNWIAAAHKYDPDEWESVITHPAVITAVLRLVLQRLDGRGEVTITDGPQTDTSWERLMGRMQPERWKAMGRESGVTVRVVDLREDEWVTSGDVVVNRRKLPGDPNGSVVFDLSTNSEFVGHRASLRGYYGADYDKKETNEAHSGGRHRYRVSRSVMEADVFINLPKMKTHKKAGITCSLKNLVGINTYKNWLPHHNEGPPGEGGDQFPADSFKALSETVFLERFKSILVKHPGLSKLGKGGKAIGRHVFGDTKHTVRSGNWYGNDTLWRTILDLNKILMYGESSGELRAADPAERRRYISVVDGIVAGEGTGPEAPTPVERDLLVFGTNPVSVDVVCATVMGFDWRKIPSIRNAFEIDRYPICDFSAADIRIEVPDESLVLTVNDLIQRTREHGFSTFTPHFGWKDHIEI